MPRNCDTILHRQPSIVDYRLQQTSIDSQLFVQNCDLCIPHLHSTPPIRGSPRRNIAMAFGMDKLKRYGYSMEAGHDGRTLRDSIGRAYA